MSHRHAWVCRGCGQERTSAPMSGGGHHNARLSDSDVIDIRQRLKAANPPTLGQLAEEKGVSHQTISLAARKVTYKDVAEPGVQPRENKLAFGANPYARLIGNHVQHHVRGSHPCNCRPEIVQAYEERNA